VKVFGLLIMVAGLGAIAGSFPAPVHYRMWIALSGSVVAVLGIITVLCDTVDDVRHEVSLMRKSLESASTE